PDISEWLISFLAKRNAHEFFHRKLFSFLLFAIPEKLANLWQKLRRAFVLIFVGMAGPKSIFVELKVFVCNSSEKHSGEATVAYRQGFDPFLSWLFVPECEWRIGRGCGVGPHNLKKKTK